MSLSATIGVHIDQKDFNDLMKELEGIGRTIGSKNLQLYRAQKYRAFAIELIERGAAGLEKIHPLTAFLAGGEHEPEWNKGSLVSHMKTRAISNIEAEAGYFGNDGKIPGSRGEGITFTSAAILQHTGYRIPLTGKKGQKVMRWLMGMLKKGGVEMSDFSSLPSTNSQMRGLYHQMATTLGFGISGGWLVVPARPFMFAALNRYEEMGGDMDAVNEFFEKLMASPSEGVRDV